MTGAIGSSALIGSAVAIDESLDENRKSRKREIDVDCPECNNSFVLSLDSGQYVGYVKGKKINCECPECYTELTINN